MSIVAYTGLPGSGKSYAAVQHQIIPALKAGRIVVTNIPLKIDLIRNDIPKSDMGRPVDLRVFPLETIATQPELMAEAVPPGAILILDEVWRLFPSGTKANQVPEQFRSFFAEHRHRVDAAGNSTQIVLVTQDLAQIGSFARQLVEQTFHVVKLSTLGIPLSNRFKVSMYAGPVSGPNPPVSGRIREVFGKYDKRVWQYYTSHTQSEAGEGIGPNEKGVDARANIFKRPFFMMMPVMLAAFAVIIYWKGGYLLDKYHKKPEAVQTGPSASGATVPVSTAQPSTSFFGTALAKVEGAGSWKVTGILQNLSSMERSYAVLTDGKGGIARVPLGKCQVIKDEPTRCRFEGFWYSETGRSSVDAMAGVKVFSMDPVNPPGSEGLGSVPKSKLETNQPVRAVVGIQQAARTASIDMREENAYSDVVLTQDPLTGLSAFKRPTVNAHSVNH